LQYGRLYAAVTGSLCAIVSGSLAVDYTLIHFYRRGAFFWDAGMYAYYMSFSDRWPLRHPPANDSPASDVSPGYSYFSIHIDPFFYLTSALNAVLGIPAATFFSLTQGLWLAILAGTCFTFSISSATSVTPNTLIVAACLSLATSLSGPVLALVGFPHFEIAIPALLLAFLCLWFSGYPRFACAALGLAFLIREDAGLHGGILLALVALSLWHSRRPRDAVMAMSQAAALCFFYSATVFLLQALLYKGGFSYFAEVYTGKPFLSHVTWRFVSDRLATFTIDKAYVTWPTLLVLGVALWKKQWSLAIGPVAVAPWLALHFFAASPEAGAINNYYAFPTILAIAWPCANYFLGLERSFTGWRNASLLQLSTSGLSIVLFVTLAAGNHDNAPWRGLGSPPVKSIGSYEQALKGVINQRGTVGALLVDNAVVSLVPKDVGHEWALIWVANRAKYGPDLIPCPDTIIYQERAYDRAHSEQVIRDCELKLAYRLNGTPFVINSRRQFNLSGVEPFAGP
jgi:hypothetical protein